MCILECSHGVSWTVLIHESIHVISLLGLILLVCISLFFTIPSKGLNPENQALHLSCLIGFRMVHNHAEQRASI
jgi:hypothetical protein